MKERTKINLERLRQHLQKNPGMSSARLAEYFGVTTETIVEKLHRIGAKQIYKASRSQWRLLESE